MAGEHLNDAKPVGQQHPESQAQDLLAPLGERGLAIERVDQPIQSLPPAGGPEVVQAGPIAGRADPGPGFEHQTKSDPPSTLTSAPVTYPLVLEAR